MLCRPNLPSSRLLAAKHHTSRGRFRDQSVLLVGYGTFNVPDGAAPLHNGPYRSELCLPDRAKEIDSQFDGSEGFLRRVPMGFACCGPADNMTVARPSPISLASNPIRRATGTSLTHARPLKSDFNGISCALMNCELQLWTSAPVPLFRGTPQDDGRPD